MNGQLVGGAGGGATVGKNSFAFIHDIHTRTHVQHVYHIQGTCIPVVHSCSHAIVNYIRVSTHHTSHCITPLTRMNTYIIV